MKESKSEIPTAAMVFKAQFMVTVSLIKKITFKPTYNFNFALMPKPNKCFVVHIH